MNGILKQIDYKSNRDSPRLYASFKRSVYFSLAFAKDETSLDAQVLDARESTQEQTTHVT